MKIQNPKLLKLTKSEYSNEDIQEIWTLLQENNALEFNKIPGRNLYMAATASNATDYTGYENVWVRDNIHIAHSFFLIGKHEQAAQTVQDIKEFWSKYIQKWKDCVTGKLDFHDVMSRPHIRFNGVKLEENSETWSHAQNDAIGYFTWLYCKLALSNSLKPDWQLLVLIVFYLAKIEYWKDADNGHWEEAAKVEASSIGAALAGLRELQKLSSIKDSDYSCMFEKLKSELGVDYGQTILSSLVSKGESALLDILPFESRDTGKERKADGALLFLIYPLEVVQGEMAEQIISNIVENLQGEYGIRRYLGDSYWMANYKKIFSEDSRTKDFSNDMSERDKHLKAGQEAQWCIFDSIISCYFGKKRIDSLTSSKDKQYFLQKQIEYLNRALAQVTGPDCKFGEFKCPESYYIEDGVYVVNDICPLLWTQANLICALWHMQQQ